MQGDSIITEQAIAILGWALGVIGILLVALSSLIFGIINNIRKKADETGNKLYELMGRCEANHKD